MRLTDEQVYEEYARLMEHRQPVPEFLRKLWVRAIALARVEEPRINSGVHYHDWSMICDDDDTMDSFYGKDYFDGEED